MVQWLGLCASTTGGLGLIPGWGAKIPHAVQHGQKKKKNLKKTSENREVKSIRTLHQHSAGQ